MTYPQTATQKYPYNAFLDIEKDLAPKAKPKPQPTTTAKTEPTEQLIAKVAHKSIATKPQEPMVAQTAPQASAPQKGAT